MNIFSFGSPSATEQNMKRIAINIIHIYLKENEVGMRRVKEPVIGLCYSPWKDTLISPLRYPQNLSPRQASHAYLCVPLRDNHIYLE